MISSKKLHDPVNVSIQQLGKLTRPYNSMKGLILIVSLLYKRNTWIIFMGVLIDLAKVEGFPIWFSRCELFSLNYYFEHMIFGY